METSSFTGPVPETPNALVLQRNNLMAQFSSLNARLVALQQLDKAIDDGDRMILRLVGDGKAIPEFLVGEDCREKIAVVVKKCLEERHKALVAERANCETTLHSIEQQLRLKDLG